MAWVPGDYSQSRAQGGTARRGQPHPYTVAHQQQDFRQHVEPSTWLLGSERHHASTSQRSGGAASTRLEGTARSASPVLPGLGWRSWSSRRQGQSQQSQNQGQSCFGRFSVFSRASQDLGCCSDGSDSEEDSGRHRPRRLRRRSSSDSKSLLELERDDNSDLEEEAGGPLGGRPRRRSRRPSADDAASVTSRDSDTTSRSPKQQGWAQVHSQTTMEQKELESADVSFHGDIFDAVLVAAFGGVRMNLDGPEELRMHPLVLLLFCFPLVCAQFTLTFCVGLSMDLNAEVVHHHADDDDFKRHFHSAEHMEISIKVLLVAILQVSFFDRLLSTVRLLLFALNPATWTDIKRPGMKAHQDAGKRAGWIYSSLLLAPLSIIAMFLKLVTQYYVNVQSASIVLASENVREAIFDSLAITFITELDVTVWEFAKTILHLDDFGEFILRLWPERTRRDNVSKSPFRAILQMQCLHRGKGARRFENMISFLCMFVLYIRLLMIVLYALKTNTVPAARDVCIQWRWLVGHPRKRWLSATIFRWIVHLLLWPFKRWWSPEQAVAEQARTFCTLEHADMSSDHWIELAQAYPRVTTTVCITLVLLLLLPELFLRKGRLREALVNTILDSDEVDPFMEAMKVADKDQRNRISRLEAELKKQKSEFEVQVNDLNQRLARAGL